MNIAERLPGESLAISASLAPEKLATALTDQPREGQIRGLVNLCGQFSQRYREAPQTCLERQWWRQFNRAGMQLREALEQAKEESYRGLRDQEIEQAYFQLIHVAYFFAPGGVAEAVWPTLPAEPEERRLADDSHSGC